MTSRPHFALLQGGGSKEGGMSHLCANWISHLHCSREEYMAVHEQSRSYLASLRALPACIWAHDSQTLVFTVSWWKIAISHLCQVGPCFLCGDEKTL